jgi:hypothetical protein
MRTSKAALTTVGVRTEQAERHDALVNERRILFATAYELRERERALGCKHSLHGGLTLLAVRASVR